MLELTYRCNLRCSFCYLASCGRLGRSGRELSTEEIFRVIDRFPGASFYLTGGEPFLRADFFRIAERIKKSGSKFGVNTNGVLLTAGKAGRLAALRPDYVIFSLHGPESVHDRMTGKKGAWRSLLGNMKRFAALAGPPTEVVASCVVNRDNSGKLSEIYETGRRAGAHRIVFEHFQFLRLVEAGGLSGNLKRGGVLTPMLEEYGADAALISRQFAAISRSEPVGPSGRSVHFETRPLMRGKELELYYNGSMRPVGKCPRMEDTLNIEPDGGIRLCVLYGLRCGNALKPDLKKILALKKRFVRSGLPSACVRCCHRLSVFRYF